MGLSTLLAAAVLLTGLVAMTIASTSLILAGSQLLSRGIDWMCGLSELPTGR
ncbi:hypothetical protein [Planctomicrobium piriforme]|uniref:Uncharacterized protein n=1 Tax=Planctomicrobium piriforme TaxID=1576369 RepID=A0A1I3L4P8_9PLAN|nr:hypothetical protein [Planctomicrobium piriforme]SFI79425.1 hypothetical protein SAMN05421753_112132 [Planctomicrobium piriforme]